jgi:putative PIN family toxin of toxin-antitoxin system
VCDTNVIVSAVLFPQSIPGQAFSHARHAGRLLITPELAAELRSVLMRPKFARYVTDEMRDEFLATYLIEAEFVAVTEHVTVCRDPKDDLVLDAAINGHAACVISGDEDLLVLTPFRDIPILRPAEYLDQFGADPS